MPRKSSGVEKISIARDTQDNGDIYVYERKTIYDPIKKYNRILSKTLIGKIPKGSTEMVDTRPKKRPVIITADQGAEIIKASKRPVGMLDIIAHVAEKSDVARQVLKAVPDDIGLRQKMLTLAWYGFASDGDTWPGVTSWSTRYSGLLPYRDTPISQDMYHDIFAYLGVHEQIKQTIFMIRAESMGKGELLALDSTTVWTDSKQLNSGRSAPHKDKLVKNVYKIVMIYSITSRQPVAYAILPGNIPDSSTVPNALEQLKALQLDDVEIVSDNGYCTEDNLLAMIMGGFKFITRIENDIQWISPLIDQYHEELAFCGEIMHCDPKFSGITTMQMHTFQYARQRGSEKSGLAKGETEEITRRLYVHIYFSSTKKADEDVKFRKQYDAVYTDLMSGAMLDKDDRAFAEKYMKVRYWGDRVAEIQPNRTAIQKRSRYHGFLVLVSRKEKDTNRALEKYRAREYVEEDIKNGKYHAGTNHPRVWTDDTLDGQLLVQFLAQSMHESFASMLRTQKESLAIANGDMDHDNRHNMEQEKALKNWLRKTSMYGILQWFDAIQRTEVEGKHWKTEMSKRDQLFLEKLGVKPRG